MRIRIDTEGDPEGLIAAIRYAEEHVVVSKADLQRIRAWAKSHRLLGELQRLKITAQPISVSGRRGRPK